MNILLVGNSYTSRNDLAQLLDVSARSAFQTAVCR